MTARRAGRILVPVPPPPRCPICDGEREHTRACPVRYPPAWSLPHPRQLANGSPPEPEPEQPLDPVTRQLLARQLRAQGRTYAEIAEQLNISWAYCHHLVSGRRGPLPAV